MRRDERGDAGSSSSDAPGMTVVNSSCSPWRILRTFPMPQFKFCFFVWGFLRKKKNGKAIPCKLTLSHSRLVLRQTSG